MAGEAKKATTSTQAPLSDADSNESNENQKAAKKRIDIKKILLFVKEKAIWLFHFLKKNFRPTWPTTLFTVSIIFLLSCFAAWHIHGFYQTKNLIAKIERNTAKERIVVPPASMLGDIDVYDYRPVEATGEMMFLNSMNLVDQEYNDEEGYHVLTPLRLDNGEIVLVDRGWVKQGQKPNNTYWKTTDITVTGTARLPDEKGFFTADNNPKENSWHWIDLVAMAKNAGVIKLYPLIISQDKISDSDTNYPIGGQTRFDIPNRHYKYAIACFMASGILFLVWCVYSIQQGILTNAKTEEDSGETGEEENREDTPEKEPKKEPEQEEKNKREDDKEPPVAEEKSQTPPSTDEEEPQTSSEDTKTP